MNFSRQLRTLALGAALTFSMVGTPALHAFAAAPQGPTPLHVRQAAVVSPALEVQAGSTGQGPATDADCQTWAGAINGNLSAAQQELNTNGMTEKREGFTDAALEYQNEAMDAGCFIVNPA